MTILNIFIGGDCLKFNTGRKVMVGYKTIRNTLMVGIIFLLLGTCIIPATGQVTKIIIPSETRILKKVNDLFIKGVIPKHPILFIIVLMQVAFRLSRGFNLFFLSGEWEWENRFPEFKVKYPLLFIRAYWLVLVGEVEFEFWAIVSDSLGWNWPIFEL